jgi:formylmethanofuran dehydrogenase subunit D
MRKSALMLSPLVAVLALSAACILFPDPGDDEGWRRIPERDGTAPRETRTEPAARPASGTEFRETLDLRKGGTLSLENDFGNVVITGWDRDTVDIAAGAAVASSGGIARTSSSTRRYVPDVEVRETGGGLMIRTRTFEGTGTPPAVDYRVRVPDSVVLTGIRLSEGDLTVSDVFGKLEASVDQGDLLVENFSGAVDVTVGTGDADVEVLDLREEDTITITCRRGNIVLRLESGVGAIVEADAPRGRVRSDFDLGVELPAATVKGWIGEGGPNIILRAPNGRVEIIKIKASGRDASGALGR